VYGNISEGFTPPEISQLYGKTGIPDLSPATYRNTEIGLRMAFLDGKLRLDSALYRLDGRDTIVSYTVTPGNSENRNAGRTRSEGIELALNFNAGAWDARLGTTFARHASSVIRCRPRSITVAKICRRHQISPVRKSALNRLPVRVWRWNGCIRANTG
jgi:outer membrane cobalamin receptor